MKHTISFSLLLIIILLFAASCGRDNSTTPGASTIYFDSWDGTAPASYEPLVIIAAPFGMEFEPASYPTAEFPFERAVYLNEIKDCYDAGASAAYVLPVAVDYEISGSYFDWSYDNFSYIFTWIAENCPGMVIGADVSGAILSVQGLVINDTLVDFVSPVYGRYLFDEVWMGITDAAIIGSQIQTSEAAGAKVIPPIVSPQQADFFVQQILPGYLQAPYHFTVHIGYENNCASTEGMFNTIVSTLPDTSRIIVVCNFDNPSELMGLAIAEGYHIRVGMKDTVYWPGGTYNPVPSSAYLVEKAIDLAIQMNREIATTEEAKTILGSYR